MADQKKSAGAKAPAKKPASTVKAAPNTARPAAKVAAKRAGKAPTKAMPSPKASEAKLTEVKTSAVKAAPAPAAAPLFDTPVSKVVAFEPKTPASAAKPASAASLKDAVVTPLKRIVETGTEQTREVYARAQVRTETLRQAVTETATVTTRGALEVNDKLIDAWQAQSDAAFDVWRSTLSAGTLSEAVQIQANGTRQILETAAARWKDVAETTTRWLGASLKPMQSTWTDQRR
jgi:hypothetical protein